MNSASVETATPPQKETIWIDLVGDAHVGVHSVLVQWVQRHFVQEYDYTIEDSMRMERKEEENGGASIWIQSKRSFCGKFESLHVDADRYTPAYPTQELLAGIDVAYFVCDITRLDTLLHLVMHKERFWPTKGGVSRDIPAAVGELLQKSSNRAEIEPFLVRGGELLNDGPLCVIVVNKCDLEKEQWTFSQEQAVAFAKFCGFADVILVSAKCGVTYPTYGDYGNALERFVWQRFHQKHSEPKETKDKAKKCAVM